MPVILLDKLKKMAQPEGCAKPPKEDGGDFLVNLITMNIIIPVYLYMTVNNGYNWLKNM